MSAQNDGGATHYLSNVSGPGGATNAVPTPTNTRFPGAGQMVDLYTPELRPFVTAKCRIGHARERAFECAWALQDRAEHLTPEQHIACIVAVMRGPDRAELGCIALAAQVFGQRQ